MYVVSPIKWLNGCLLGDLHDIRAPAWSTEHQAALPGTAGLQKRQQKPSRRTCMVY